MTQHEYQPEGNIKAQASEVIEGITSVSACIKAIDDGKPSREIYEILVDSAKASGGSDRTRRRIAYLKAKSAEHGFTLRFCTGEEISSVTSGNTHGGIAALVSRRHVKPLDSSDIIQGGFYMLFDGIEDPYSFGYSLRSLYAASRRRYNTRRTSDICRRNNIPCLSRRIRASACLFGGIGRYRRC